MIHPIVSQRPLWPYRLNRRHPLAAGMVLWWPLDPACPTAELARAWPTTLNGNGSWAFGAVQDRFGRCFTNDSSAGRSLQIQNPTTGDFDFNAKNEWTAAIWVEPANTATKYFLDHQRLVGTGGFYLIQKQGKFAGGFVTTTYAELSASSTYTIGQLYHFVARHTPTLDSLWINGVKDAEAAAGIPPPNSSDPIRGLDYLGGGYNPSGKFADVCVWNRALSDSEIAQMYARPFGHYESRYIPLSAHLSVQAGYRGADLLSPLTGF